MRYWHGGAPGLRVGSLILPRRETGAPGLARYADSLDAPEYFRRDDVVYVTAVRDVARVYAALYPDGALYEVRPDGEVLPDPDHTGTDVSFMAPRAVVLRVVDPVVLLRLRPVEAWLRMLDKVP